MVATLVGAAPSGTVEADFTGLRSAKGQLLVCLTSQPANFPDCQNDPNARRMKVPARKAGAVEVTFADLPSGDYAIAMIHDENGNNKLDTMFGIPREGFGFSRNPAIRFGPPRFGAARFAVSAGTVDERVTAKYLL